MQIYYNYTCMRLVDVSSATSMADAKGSTVGVFTCNWLLPTKRSIELSHARIRNGGGMEANMTLVQV